MIKNTQRAKLNKKGETFVIAIQLILSIIIVLSIVWILDLKNLTTNGESISFRNATQQIITNIAK